MLLSKGAASALSDFIVNQQLPPQQSALWSLTKLNQFNEEGGCKLVVAAAAR